MLEIIFTPGLWGHATILSLATLCRPRINHGSSTEPINFPTKEEFFNKLTDQAITDEQWEHGQTIFNNYCPNRTMGEYHDLYLHSDVLLLADFFEKYRKTCHTHYGLDPLHFFSAPGTYFFFR